MYVLYVCTWLTKLKPLAEGFVSEEERDGGRLSIVSVCRYLFSWGSYLVIWGGTGMGTANGGWLGAPRIRGWILARALGHWMLYVHRLYHVGVVFFLPYLLVE